MGKHTISIINALSPHCHMGVANKINCWKPKNKVSKEESLDETRLIERKKFETSIFLFLKQNLF